MGTRCMLGWCVVVAAAMTVGGASGRAQGLPVQVNPPAELEGVDVLTRGPVHEAFAGTVAFDPQAGIVVPKAPHAAIEELPPDQRPEGTNVAWIPGYWAWDDERSDFVWVSGIWRSLPPGRQWVPGYWAQAAGGFQWTSGYWADAQAAQVEYLPPPPTTVEAGPNISAPSADYAWIPGCWVWHAGRYVWRPGYWAAMQTDWVWMPAHYVWTPRGYVYVGGYWDYAVPRRGVLFAPVYFRVAHCRRHGYHYSPSVVINLAYATDHLFLRPSYGHYYFGDYYAAAYVTAGYYPWFSLHVRRHGYNPFYAQQSWLHRHDRDWERRVKVEFVTRRDRTDTRPPRTVAEQRRLATSSARPPVRTVVVPATPLRDVARDRKAPVRFQPIDTRTRNEIGRSTRDVHKSRDERAKLEAPRRPTPSARKPPTQTQPTRERLPKTPIVSQPAARFQRGQAPPKTYKPPKPEPDVEPRPRSRRDDPAPPSVRRGRDEPPPKSKSDAEPKPRSRRDEPEPSGGRRR